LLLQQVKQVYSFEEKYTEAMLHQQVAKSARPHSRSPTAQKSGLGKRVASGRGAAAAAAVPLPDGEDAATHLSPPGTGGTTLSAVGLSVDEKVQHYGLIFNPLSGRNIKIGGDTYLRLLDQGWVPDKKRGVMVAVFGEEGAGRTSVSNDGLCKGSKAVRPR
jgi:hypothetical protein